MQAVPSLSSTAWPVAAGRRYAPALLVSSSVCGVLLLALSVSSAELAHWFVFPVAVCGAMIGTDAVRWWRGHLELFDPQGVIGLLGMHFFFLAPLLHVTLDYWMPYVTPPTDWRPWLGWMAMANAVGILVYKATSALFEPSTPRPSKTIWLVDHHRFYRVLAISLVGTGLLQLLVYRRFGGVMGYIRSFEEEGLATFQGMGAIFVVSESFPILAFIGFAVYTQRRQGARTWVMIALALLGFFVLKLLFGGLRGSRSNTVWGLLWAVGIVHLWIRPIPRKLVPLGLALLVGFMYVYGFYKSYGTDALQIFDGSANRSALEATSNRSMTTTVLGDFARSDVQAYLLYRMVAPAPGEDYEYALGRTYLGTVALLVPSSLWPDRPPLKVKEGTEVLFGEVAYQTGWRSSKLYGLAGETMLNFGPLLAPLSFAVLGVVVGYVKRLSRSWATGDSRTLLLPFLVNLCFLTLIADSDNLLFFIIKNGLVPCAVIAVASQRCLLAAPAQHLRSS